MKSQHFKQLLISGVVLGLLTTLSPLSETARAGAANCATILQRATDTLKLSCSDVGRNEACYGNDDVTAELREPALNFNTVGARIAVHSISRLSASALNLQAQTWGLSLLKLKVNLPDALPGQNVTFLIYGNTSVENASEDMQAFYFTTGLGAPQCKEVPNDAILVHSPKGTKVTFSANGVDITIGSVALITAEPNGSMSFSLIQGSASLKTAGGEVSVKPNQMSTIPLGGLNGLQAVGAPSTPVDITFDANVISLLTSVSSLFDGNQIEEDSATPAVTSESQAPTATKAAKTKTPKPSNDQYGSGNGNNGKSPNSNDSNGSGNGNNGGGDSGGKDREKGKDKGKGKSGEDD
ncbi:MAG: hypothetical protein U0528_18570 [Anaerolineae bacterium]